MHSLVVSTGRLSSSAPLNPVEHIEKHEDDRNDAIKIHRKQHTQTIERVRGEKF